MPDDTTTMPNHERRKHYIADFLTLRDPVTEDAYEGHVQVLAASGQHPANTLAEMNAETRARREKASELAYLAIRAHFEPAPPPAA